MKKDMVRDYIYLNLMIFSMGNGYIIIFMEMESMCSNQEKLIQVNFKMGRSMAMGLIYILMEDNMKDHGS